jgi:hypothetical protein
MKHTGSFEDLQAVIKALGFEIEWAGVREQCQQIRTNEGAIVNFFETTRTIQFQGKREPKERLEARFKKKLEMDAQAQGPRKNRKGSKQECIRAGWEEGKRWAQNAKLRDIRHALTELNLAYPTSDEILGDYFRIRLQGSRFVEEQYAGWAKGWREGVIEIWNEVKDRLNS